MQIGFLQDLDIWIRRNTLPNKNYYERPGVHVLKHLKIYSNKLNLMIFNGGWAILDTLCSLIN